MVDPGAGALAASVVAGVEAEAPPEAFKTVGGRLVPGVLGMAGTRTPYLASLRSVELSRLKVESDLIQQCNSLGAGLDR